MIITNDMHFGKIRLLLLNIDIIDGMETVEWIEEIKLVQNLKIIGCIIKKEPRTLINKGF